MKKNNLIIFGVGETARLAYEYFQHDSGFVVVAFAVNQKYKTEDVFSGLPLVAIEEVQSKYNSDKHHVFVAMGSGHLNRDRQKVFLEAKKMGYKCASYISSKAFVWHDVAIGENCFILENNVLQSGVKIGDNVTLWSGNHIGHLSRIEDHCFISSHVVISGSCVIGQNCFIGVNSAFANGVTIGRDNFIGLGSVINSNTEDNSIYTCSLAVKSKVSAKKLSKVQE
jgi:sugar O-acyltransferase (sialic acid O-acetyltransferase NeuD family)